MLNFIIIQQREKVVFFIHIDLLTKPQLSFTLENEGYVPLKKPMILQTRITLGGDVQIYPWSMLEYRKELSLTYEFR